MQLYRAVAFSNSKIRVFWSSIILIRLKSFYLFKYISVISFKLFTKYGLSVIMYKFCILHYSHKILSYGWFLVPPLNLMDESWGYCSSVFMFPFQSWHLSKKYKNLVLFIIEITESWMTSWITSYSKILND